ncbi:LacI family DNA-binding transcriptional regulator [Amycolatopsis mongoliensis]|uniref:LacI family DNA-binding transcriptional regulator n=1 Tax=Amycolatopsis mongoliensis TaxID=715475 RepID=A0A9Y2JZ21_9PSEU|nr:LacI family DNA-binding transcriptional regulator [Amycolatopsis sp. 4-36]WIY06246.1 LacI family DNA-binding transcriptional regulator [Amycolatopsis sp. 4-36]
MATISDVAALAGVSTATVSRALNGKSTVDPTLAGRVARAVEELGYTPNGLARSLRRRETAVLALIISDVENPFFTAIARGAEDAAQAAGYSVMLCNSDESTAKERRYVEVAAQERLAGVIMSPTTADSDVRPLTTHRTPIVTVDRRLASADCDAVLLDSRAAARDAVSHLASQGYRRIGCIAGPPGVTTADDRLDGYRDGLRAAGRKYSAKLVRRGEFREAGGREAATRLLAEPGPPDALLVSSSTMSVGVLQVMAELGLRSGRDVGIVSFDDAPWATLISPALTVVAQPAHAMGRLAARLLLDRIGDGGSRATTTTTMAAQLIVRGSSTR